MFNIFSEKFLHSKYIYECKKPEGDEGSQQELNGAKRSNKKPKELTRANRSQQELKEAKGSLGSQQLSKVDKWNHNEALATSGSLWESYGVIESHREP